MNYGVSNQDSSRDLSSLSENFQPRTCSSGDVYESYSRNNKIYFNVFHFYSLVLILSYIPFIPDFINTFFLLFICFCCFVTDSHFYKLTEEFPLTETIDSRKNHNIWYQHSYELKTFNFNGRRKYIICERNFNS